MPKIGLLKPMYVPFTVATDTNGVESEQYGTAKSFGEAVSVSTTINTAKAKFYANDSVSEMVNEFTGGTIAMEVGDIEDDVLVDINGVTIDGTSKDVVFKDTDTPNYVRFGGIVRRFKNNKSQYRGFIFTKIMWDVVADNFQTKGESIVFSGEKLTGEIMRNIRHEWKVMSKWLDTRTDAEAWLTGAIVPEAEETQGTEE